MSVSLIDGHIDDDTPRMTDNEIIKALEWHLNDETHCSDCPYEEHSVTHFCVEFVLKDALDLINRQKAEIERLEQENFDRSLTIETWKVEAVKEFAERLKEIITMSPKSSILIDKWYIDNLVKEMVGDTE